MARKNILQRFNGFVTNTLTSAPARFLEAIPNAILNTPARGLDAVLGSNLSGITQKLSEGDLPGVAQTIRANTKSSVASQKKLLAENPTAFGLNFVNAPGGIAKKAVSVITKPNAVSKFIKPSITNIRSQGSPGQQLEALLTRASDVGEIEAGKRIASIKQFSLEKLPRLDRFDIQDALQGKAVSNPKIGEIATKLRLQLDEVATRAKEYGVKVKEKKILTPQDVFFGNVLEDVPPGLTDLQRTRLKKGQRVPATLQKEFTARENFFPHSIPAPELLTKGQVRDDVIENLVRQKVRPDKESASAFLDDYIEYVKNGSKEESLVNYLVETGQAKTPAEAFKNLQNYRTKSIKRQGSLEYERNVDLPFYDPDPARVIPDYLIKSEKRLAQIKELGQDDEAVNKLILKIRDSGGDADFVRASVDQILNKINTTPNPALNLLRTLQGFKLSLATIPNSTQGILNTFLAADMRAVAAGVKASLTHAGKDFALRSGATLEAVTKEAIDTSGNNIAEKGLQKMLKLNGFNATERFNRTMAANGGANYARRLFATLEKNPANKSARQFLSELGLNVDEALKKGLSEDDILMAAKKFSDLTQFRSRPQDLPMWASTPGGKVFFQFKNFIYGQTRLLHRVTVKEFQTGNYGRGTRNLMLLATIFPLTGEAVIDIRYMLQGKKRESKGLKRYFENIAGVGAMGILSDAVSSGIYGRGLDFLVGPTVSTMGQALNIAGSSNKSKDIGKLLLGQAPFGSLLKNRLFPPKKKTKPSTRFQMQSTNSKPYQFPYASQIEQGAPRVPPLRVLRSDFDDVAENSDFVVIPDYEDIADDRTGKNKRREYRRRVN